MNFSNNISATFCAPASGDMEQKVYVLECLFPALADRIVPDASLQQADAAVCAMLDALDSEEVSERVEFDGIKTNKSAIRSFLSGLHETATVSEEYTESGFIRR